MRSSSCPCPGRRTVCLLVPPKPTAFGQPGSRSKASRQPVAALLRPIMGEKCATGCAAPAESTWPCSSSRAPASGTPYCNATRITPAAAILFSQFGPGSGLRSAGVSIGLVKSICDGKCGTPPWCGSDLQNA
ncbi:hypothetical protein C8035_v009211 [Colletotrichum spinosum]|uniref:Uncharacterized protein n=1 Tax=Colletotrichum spinosum TaxID=1347390 RepID=A0A4R8QA49_9PEZI|nr:hypothetical protein C8035_v009211 [Colletotrichum spinosum]